MKLIIDVVESVIILESRVMAEKWVEFFALLALSRTDEHRRDEFLSARRLHDMVSWRGDVAFESVGKMVARECAALEKQGLGVIECRGKTKMWRLGLGPETIEFRSSREDVARWVRAREFTAEVDQAWVEQLGHLIDAQLAIYTGEGAKARDSLREISTPVSPDFEAWAGFLDAQATDLYVDVEANPDALDGLAADWEGRSDPLGRVVAAKIAARIGLRKRAHALQESYALLSKRASEQASRCDIAGQASVLNVLGILATRLERPGEAVQHLLRAAPMFAVINDLNGLQAAVFNLANAKVKARQLAGQAPDHLCLALLDQSLKICRLAHTGRDSVQSEIAGVQWAMDMGDYVRARGFLEAGAETILTLDSAFEQGCYLFARARLERSDPRGEHDLLRDLKAARREFVSVGFDEPLADIDAMIRECEAKR